jgi:hypothetical protein
VEGVGDTEGDGVDVCAVLLVALGDDQMAGLIESHAVGDLELDTIGARDTEVAAGGVSDTDAEAEGVSDTEAVSEGVSDTNAEADVVSDAGRRRAETEGETDA